MIELLSLQKAKNAPLPIRYMGLWRRILLETAHGNDNTSLVFWMQTQRHHIDIRIPSSRQVSNVSSIDEYTDEELLQLADQQGFFGLTRVDADICQWHREIDYQPQNHHRDIGKMAFDGADTLLETGVDQKYLEIWKKQDIQQQLFSQQVVTGTCREGSKVEALFMRAGKYVAYARPRRIVLPPSESLKDAIQIHKPSREVLLDWLDFEISFGEYLDDEHWRINHSTLPFKEKMVMVMPLPLNRFPGQFLHHI